MKIHSSFICRLSVILLFVSCNNANNEIAPEKVRVALRAIGHQLLLDQQDTASLILPIEQTDPLTYRLKFENDLAIIPDSLISITRHFFKKTSMPKQYIVEVVQCADKQVAYSYQMQKTKDTEIIPCKGRHLPNACYYISVKFSTANVASNKWIIFLISVIVLASFLYYYKHKQLSSIEKINNDRVIIGHFSFYPKQHKLVKQAEEIALSKKECELLMIFVSNANKIITREELTKKIWEDNGVIVGRSLDTYVSKLRKKLKGDACIKIVNVHGVGYKLEINPN